MPRPLKPYKVDEVSDLSRSVAVDVMLDREEKDFFARFDADNVVRAPTARECKALAHEMLQRVAGGYRWRRFIEVSLKDDQNTHFSSRKERQITRVHVELEVRRMERAPKLGDPDGPMHVERAFEEDLDDWHRRARAEGKEHVDHVWREGAGVEPFPYTEEAWTGLLAIVQAFRDAEARVGAFLRKDDLPRLLADLSRRPPAFLLTTGTEVCAAPESPDETRSKKKARRSR